MDEATLQAEVQALADTLEAKAKERGDELAVPIGVLLATIWELIQRDLPGELVQAKGVHRRALKSSMEQVAKLRSPKPISAGS